MASFSGPTDMKKQIAGEGTRTIVGNVADEGIPRQLAQQAISAPNGGVFT
jgi:hypothetical protein